MTSPVSPRRRQLLAAALPLPITTTAPAWAATAMKPERNIVLDLALATQPLDRFFDHSVGADFPGTLYRDDSLAQLGMAVEELGFRYLRFHAIFHDVFKTVTRDARGQLVFNFDGIDKLHDAMLARRIRPFVELGFTPLALASSTLKIFYWEGNTSHPEPAGWVALINAFTRHILARYGAAEVRQWYFEVWNEPNLDGFWEKADQPAYFDLYTRTAKTIKAIDPQLRVGGPATAGAAWVPEFLAHAKATATPVDFVTTHTYAKAGDYTVVADPGKVGGSLGCVGKKMNAMVKVVAPPPPPVAAAPAAGASAPRTAIGPTCPADWKLNAKSVVKKTGAYACTAKAGTALPDKKPACPGDLTYYENSKKGLLGCKP